VHCILLLCTHLWGRVMAVAGLWVMRDFHSPFCLVTVGSSSVFALPLGCVVWCGVVWCGVVWCGVVSPAPAPRAVSLAFSSTSTKRLTTKKKRHGAMDPLAATVTQQASGPPVGSVLALESTSEPGSVDEITLDAVCCFVVLGEITLDACASFWVPEPGWGWGLGGELFCGGAVCTPECVVRLLGLVGDRGLLCVRASVVWCGSTCPCPRSPSWRWTCPPLPLQASPVLPPPRTP
jgi:hypothetical protein